MAASPADPRPVNDPAGAFDAMYAGRPPWDIGRPQAAFVALADAGLIRGRVLDAGCGTGEHVLMCAALGLDATGVDLAQVALRAAQEKARARGLTARFIRQDARHLSELGEIFDTVLDCGLFHLPLFTEEDRAGYVASLRSVLGQGGRYFMLCFSDREPGSTGPLRLTQDQIRTAFADGGWQIDSIDPATIEITTDPAGVRAWLVTATRR
jgi:cyclopropane fatty-acyl-phospholipid synthase-like methyltransferase